MTNYVVEIIVVVVIIRNGMMDEVVYIWMAQGKGILIGFFCFAGHKEIRVE